MITSKRHRIFLTLTVALSLSGCATLSEQRQDSVILKQDAQVPKPVEVADSATVEDTPPETDNTVPQTPNSVASNNRLLPGTVTLNGTTQTGKLGHPQLTELSGLIASRTMPGVLFAINDSGNEPMLFALSEKGQHLRSWNIDARNRDWEDMAWASIGEQSYLVIGDTGDNLKVHSSASLLFFKEPALQSPIENSLRPDIRIDFTYEDGPRNVEAFAIEGNSVLLLSKEPLTENRPSPGHLYQLQIPTAAEPESPVAIKLATLPLASSSFESRIVAALTGVDLNHPTAMDFDPVSNTAYVLTYRHVNAIKRNKDQTWADAFASKPTRLHTHWLNQAEALAITPGRAIWFSSESSSAPLWAIPIDPPL